MEHLSFFSDNKRLVSADTLGNRYIWDTEKGELIRTISTGKFIHNIQTRDIL